MATKQTPLANLKLPTRPPKPGVHPVPRPALRQTVPPGQLPIPKPKTENKRISPKPSGPTTSPLSRPRLHVPQGPLPFPGDEAVEQSLNAPASSNTEPVKKQSNHKVSPERAGDSPTAEKSNALNAAMERARKGDESVLPELRELIADIPSETTGGDLGRVIVNHMLEMRFKNDLYAKEVVKRKMAEIRNSLSGPKPTQVESLLIDRILCCWLRLHLAELSTGFAEVTGKPLGPAMTKSLERLNKQYQVAIKALGDIRKMNIVIQVNVARRQQILNKTTQEIP